LKITDERNRFALVLILIALIAAIPRFVLGASQFVEYDGYWHVFIAQQDNWHNFWEDIRDNAHPPLFFLLLKFLLHFGRSILIYRSISLVTGIISVFSVGWIARKIVKSDLWAYTAAMAYGFALPGIIMSCEVRSYMLSAFFILLSFSCLLDIGIQGESSRGYKLRAGFALAAILACLSHFYAFFYVGAAGLLVLGWYALRKYRGEPVNGKADVVTIAPVFGVVFYLYRTHAGSMADIQNHLRPYYFDPKGSESILAFLFRNGKNLINLFSPCPISSDAATLALLTLGVIAGLALLAGFLRAHDAASVRAASTILVTTAMLGAIVVTAVAGKYPFGGDLRQQFLLFPFLVLCAAILADRLTALMPAKGRLAVGAAAALLIVWVSAVRFEQLPKSSENVLSDRIDEFNRLEPEPAAVYLDQWNLITFFIYHHDWKWSFLKQQPIPGIAIYRISRGDRQMLVFRDKTVWNMKFGETPVYQKLAQCLRDGKTPEVSVFGALQTPPDKPYSRLRLMRRTILGQAADLSICAERLTLREDGWYGSFRQSGCDALDLKPPRATGKFDGTSDEIDYYGSWTRARYPAAVDGTLNYSKAAGSSAQLSFEGTEITWVYARAGNRGIGSVKIDGVPRGEIDLYNPKIVWQSHTTFGGLAPGKHTFEVTVAGRKDAAATDQYIDIDALVVR
jgi:hypothetical protein